ncbi:MAG: serC 2 [Fibrobacteres bacterium]|nr:serC 2 [Fibrobacterota bacterium]
MTYRFGYLYALILAGTIASPARSEGGSDACAAGKRLYMEKCSQCHGESGDGKGVGADFFNPRPRDFTSGAFKLRTTESGELPTGGDLAKVIRNGMPYTGMPAWPRFSDGEVADLVCFLKTLNPDFADTSVHPKTVTVPKPPAYREESARKGRAIYEENKCLDCHGSLGRGDGESAPTLKDDWGNPIRPADLTRRWTFRGGHRREDIYRTFMTGLNGTPMPSFMASVKEEDRWPLVDYVYSLSKGDDPGYASMVTAVSAKLPKDADGIREALARSKPALFPVIGQVIEGRRNFFPAANAVEVRAAYDSESVAILVSWHDMSPQTSGSNSPLASKGDSSRAPLTDAVALQIPFKAPEGNAKPYFLAGDKKNPVEFRFADLGKGEIRDFLGKGWSGLTASGAAVKADARYDSGEWSVLFLRPRRPAKGLAMDRGVFVPIAFSVWDGFSGESGEHGGVTSWYTLYLKPPEEGSPILPAAARALAALAAGAAIVFAARFRLGRPGAAALSKSHLSVDTESGDPR